jgi:signal transduction histidine kinase
MRSPRFGLFRRIYLVVFLLIALLGILFTGITYLVTTSFYEASTQLLNKDVASHIARFTSPYGREGFDRRKADSVFYDAMVISPSAEVYFLDTSGRVIYFHGERGEIRRWQVPMGDIQRYIRSGGQRYISGPDPRDPAHAKIFSAAAVEDATGPMGYIYVVLGNRQYRSVTQMLYSSRVTPVFLGAVLFILSFSLLVTMLYIQRIRRRFDEMMIVLNKFRTGDFSARFALGGKDELELVMGSFNKMADLLLDNIDRVTSSEKERRDFMVNISHDLRTPLAIARGFAETLALKKGQLSEEEERAYGNLVVGKIRQVEKMVNQLFELSKMESANFETLREPFVFSEVLQEVIQDLRPADGNVPAINCSHCTDGAFVMADISMMERVLQNLVVNALAYTPAAGRIDVMLERVGGVLRFRIENEGAPLPVDLLDWLNSANTFILRPVRPAIGLAIVRKILLLHHFPFSVGIKPHGINVISFEMPVYDPFGIVL